MPKAVKRPFTPRRLTAFLESVLSSSRRKDKRPRVHAPASPTKIGHSSTTGAPSIALQNEDLSNDAIVITTLPETPFCCHEDLVAMNRPQLEHVACALNDRLPAALQIDITPARSDAFLRNSIELAVGLRTHPAPPAATASANDENAPPPKPKHARSKSFDVGQMMLGPRPPVTPPRPARSAHKRARSQGGMGLAYGLYSAHPAHSPRLEILEEAEDEDESTCALGEADHERRPQKKRRTDADMPATAPNTSTTPTPGPRRALHRRTPSYHGGPLYGHAPVPAPIYRPGARAGLRRSMSTGMSEFGGMRAMIDLDVATKMRYRPKEQLGQTSTPKRSMLAVYATVSSAPSASMCSTMAPRPSAVAAMMASSSPPPVLGARDQNREIVMCDANSSPTRSAPRLKRKAEDAELTFGIDGMTISMALSRSSDLMDLEAL